MARAKQRVPVRKEHLQHAEDQINRKLIHRLVEKGHFSYISSHEALGILTEEYLELAEAVKSNRVDDVESELIDLAVGCRFALASLRAHTE